MAEFGAASTCRRRGRLLHALVPCAVLLASCSGGDGGVGGRAGNGTTSGATTSGRAPSVDVAATNLVPEVGKPTEAASFAVRPGIGYVSVTDAPAGAALSLVDASGNEVKRTVVDRLGSHHFRDLKPGEAYEVRVKRPDGKVEGTDPVKVLRFEDHPGDAFYRSADKMTEGYQYLTTRDGTTLAVTVRAPFGATLDQGPFPTVINMSGYADADPDSPPPMALLAQALGYATVSVNERGTGCSGGINELFDLTWTADGYDVVETVAAQPWVTRVGLVGISFPGITQLFTAGARPPHLAAAAPMSVLSDIYRAPGYPGGIFNTGFTRSWLTDRQYDALPSPEGGQGYARTRIEGGDTECRDNQLLRLETQDVIALTRDKPYREPDLIDVRSPINWVDKIEVPMLLSNAWQDEQVGAGFGHLFAVMPKRPDVKSVVANGVHSTALEPELIAQWAAFLDIYVAERVPDVQRLAGVFPTLFASVLGSDAGVPALPADPLDGPTTLAEARSRYEALPRLRVLFDNGGDPAAPGMPHVGFEAGFDSWPPKETEATRWFFGPDGALDAKSPESDDATAFDRYFPDAFSRPMQTIPGQGQSESWAVLPDYDWRPLVARTAVAYATPPLTEDTTMVGPGSVDLWLRINSTDTDLQVTLSEIRPDGLETYVQSGWLRASHRKLDSKRSTEVDPWHTHLESDAQPMPPGEFVKVRVPIDPVAHVFRSGSRLRLSVEAPGGDRTRWAFETPRPDGHDVNDVGRSAAHPSSVVLPLTRAVKPTTPLPPCPSLRGQPCRPYEPTSNGG